MHDGKHHYHKSFTLLCTHRQVPDTLHVLSRYCTETTTSVCRQGLLLQMCLQTTAAALSLTNLTLLLQPPILSTASVCIDIVWHANMESPQNKGQHHCRSCTASAVCQQRLLPL